MNQVILYFLFTRFSYQVFLQEMRFLSLLYWLERFYVPIGITKLLSLWSCFSFLLMSLYYHLRSYLSILFRIFFVLFLFYFTYSCCISVFFTNYCIYSDYFIYITRKALFLQQSKWVFKKGFLQDIRHNLWEIFICFLAAVWSYQVELFM